VDRRIESEESGDEEAKKRVVEKEEGQNMRIGESRENPQIEVSAPVEMEALILDPEAEDIDLNHMRIGKIEGFEVLKKAKTVCLRQNLIKKIENLEELKALRELDLYDNEIKKVENLEALEELELLDFFFGGGKNFTGNFIVQLKSLDLLSRKPQSLTKLLKSSKLTSVQLAKVIENIDTLTKLDSLFLGNNKIPKLQNLDGLTNLTVLSIQSNRITKIEGLQSLLNLRELYISHNGIEVIEGLESNKKLTTLDIAANKVKKIENISHLTELEEFWMNDNLIENWSDLDELKNAKKLETVYLERNPLQKDPQYRRKIMLALPSVRQIDATFIRF
uniref:Protein phosphatase 1 regulatory subunit 7 n=1 Tax=Latimeria chalumnae TaxID=7897 RepID=H3AL25_LATCH